MPLDAQILLSILAHESSSEDISRTLRVTPASYSLVLSDGTGANQAQVAWSDSRTIAAVGTDTLDLTALQDDRGAVAFSQIKLIYIRNTGTVRIFWARGQSGDWADGPLKQLSDGGFGLEIPAGGLFLATNPSAAGWGVDDGDIVIFNDSEATAATYDIILIGEGTVT